MYYSDLKNWPILSYLKHDFVSEIHMVMVYGYLGNTALIVMKNKKVYALGGKKGIFLTEVEALCGKDVKTFACGNIHVLALTHNGEVYSWSDYPSGYLSGSLSGSPSLSAQNSGQQIIYTTYPLLVEIPIVRDNKRHHVKDIACGTFHSLVVTNEGEVFAWGKNDCGQVGSDIGPDQKIPRQIHFNLTGKKIVQVACGHNFSIAVTNNGDVYSWGDNSVGQLGRDTSVKQNPANQFSAIQGISFGSFNHVGPAGVNQQGRRNNHLNQLGPDVNQHGIINNHLNQVNPCKIDLLQGIVIVKVVCGFNHVLARTDTGKLYAWGGNNYGQLGIGNKINTCKPCMVTHEMGRVSDIAALHSSNISIAVGEGKFVYMWGKCLGEDILEPILTPRPFSTMYDAFACFDFSKVMHKPLILHEDNESNIFESDIDTCYWKAFNDKSTSDLTIKVENQLIHVHKAILMIRCPYFNNMFQHNWSENKQSVLEYDDFSYTVFKAFLKFLYTDVVDLPPEETVELLKLADKYSADLKRHCVLLIKREIKVENVIDLYKTAIDYNVKELEEFCLSFASKHLTAVMQSGKLYKTLNDFTLADRFMEKMALAGAFKT